MCGLAAEDAIRDVTAASAPLDPPLPVDWTVRAYVSWSARLAGQPKRDAHDRATDAMERLKIEGLADGAIRRAPEARRAIVVAAALATGATTLLLEDPLRGLPNDTARSFARTVARATSELRTVIFAARVSLASPLAIDADEAVVIQGSRVVGQGAPAEVAARDRAYRRPSARPRSPSFAQLAEKAWPKVSCIRAHGSLWTVDLGASLRTSDLFDIAAASDTVVLELRPLAYAFSLSRPCLAILAHPMTSPRTSPRT